MLLTNSLGSEWDGKAGDKDVVFSGRSAPMGVWTG